MNSWTIVDAKTNKPISRKTLKINFELDFKDLWEEEPGTSNLYETEFATWLAMLIDEKEIKLVPASEYVFSEDYFSGCDTGAFEEATRGDL